MAGGLLRLSGLQPAFATNVRIFLEWTDRYGIPVTVVSGYRSLNEQRDLYAKGRTSQQIAQRVSLRGAQGSVTDAFPGSSPHNYGLAVDLDSPRLSEARQLAQFMGFGTVSWDLPHIEWPGWQALTRAR
jgi:LAS superfamily LD-carboxypeptidase LdcB